MGYHSVQSVAGKISHSFNSLLLLDTIFPNRYAYSTVHALPYSFMLDSTSDSSFSASTVILDTFSLPRNPPSLRELEILLETAESFCHCSFHLQHFRSASIKFAVDDLLVKVFEMYDVVELCMSHHLDKFIC